MCITREGCVFLPNTQCFPSGVKSSKPSHAFCGDVYKSPQFFTRIRLKFSPRFPMRWGRMFEKRNGFWWSTITDENFTDFTKIIFNSGMIELCIFFFFAFGHDSAFKRICTFFWSKYVLLLLSYVSHDLHRVFEDVIVCWKQLF